MMMRDFVTKDSQRSRMRWLDRMVDSQDYDGYQEMTLDLHEDSLELDANDKGGGKRQDLQGIQCPQKITCRRRSYDGCDRIEARMEKAEGAREMDDS